MKYAAIAIALFACTGCTTLNLYSGTNHIGPVRLEHELKYAPPCAVKGWVNIEYTGVRPWAKEPVSDDSPLH